MINNFVYQVPVQVVFGQGKISEVGTYVKQYEPQARDTDITLFNPPSRWNYCSRFEQ